MLFLAPVIERQLIKAIIEDKVIQFWVNILVSSSIDNQNSNLWYSISSPKAKFKLENGFKVIAFLNINTNINVMTKNIMKDLGLAI